MKQKKATASSENWGHFAVREAFTEPEQLLGAFLDALTIGLAICDDRLRYQAINNVFAAMNGVRAEAHLGKTLRDVLGHVAPKVAPAFEQVFATGQPLLNFELTAELPTRTDVGYWIGSYFPIKDASGRVKQVVAIVVEVTKQKKLETALRKLMGQLLRIKDDEPRWIAPELHDSINQYHAACLRNLHCLSLTELGPEGRSTPAQVADNLTQYGSVDRQLAGFPWAIVQHGVSAKGVFQVVPEYFLQESATVVGYFRTKEEAEQFLTQFSSPTANMLPKVWPASIAEPLWRWYEALEGAARRKLS